MRTLALGVALLTGLGLAGPGLAQHAGASSSSISDADAGGCKMCHAAHGRGNGVYTLRMGDVADWDSWARTQAPGLGPISQSCLRCHTTAARRASQPAQGASGAGSAHDDTYLGLDLSDDHRLGRILDSDGSTPAGEWSALGFERGPLGTSGRVPIESLECTTCHDPHNRSGSLQTQQGQQLLCGTCHDPSRYVWRGHASLACTDCHKLHRGHDSILLAEPFPNVLCDSCHDPSATPTTRTASLRGPQGHLEPMAGTCIGCHTVHR
jgi:predicted CXXCH cytochrome family protein